MIKIKNSFNFRRWPRKKAISVLLVLAVLLAAAVFLVTKNNKTPAASNSYATATVQRGAIESTIDGAGTLQPSERYALKTWSGGTVTEVLVAEGTQVTQGQPLMTVKNDELDSSAKQANLEWEIAQSDLNDMYDPPAETDYDLRTAQLKVEQYKIALEDAKAQQEKLILKAPFDGTILTNELKVGQRVGTNVTAATFATAGEMEVVASFSDSDINVLSKDMEANIFVKGLSKTYSGKVKEIAFEGTTSGSTSAGAFEVLISLDNPDDSLRSGMQTYNTVIIVRDVAQDVFIYKQASGYLRYTQSEDMVTEVSGTVAEIYHQPGVKIYKGEPLMRLTNPEIDRAVKSAEVNLANAEDSLELILHPDEDTIKAQELKVEQNYQKVLTAKKKLDSLNVSAPIDGVVTSISVKPGDELGEDTSSSGQELLVVCNFAKNYLEISVDELDINKITFGQEAYITIDALPDAKATGKIIGIAQEGATSDGVTTYAVTIEVGYVEGIKGGMSATATISLEKKENVLRVPSEALTNKKDGAALIQVLQDGQLVTKTVKTGVDSGTWVEITSGLEEGEKIIVAKVAGTAATSQPGGMPMGGGMGGGPSGPPSSGRTTTRR